MRIRIYFMEILSKIVQRFRFYYYSFLGYDIKKSTIMESKLNLDKVYPQGIHIGENTLVAMGATILCHEHVKRDPNDYRMPLIKETFIGKNCFIGINVIVLPGIKIGDEVIVGSGSIVTKDVPSNCIVAGNPAKIIKTGIKMNSRAEWVNL